MSDEKLPAVLTVEMIEEAAKKAANQGTITVLAYTPPELTCQDETCECKCEE